MLKRWLRSERAGKRRRVPVLLIMLLTAIGLVGSLFLVWSTIEGERAQREQASRTIEILTALRDIDRAAVNAESGQRGYFITLDRRYLASYEFGQSLYPRALERLKVRVREGVRLPRQEELLAAIEENGDAKFDELAATVAQIERGEIREAQLRILADDGRLKMERLRAALSEMETLEQDVLAGANAKAAASEERVLPLLSVTLLLMLGALAIGLWQTVRASQTEILEAQARDLAEARDRADLLAHELNHRVKNLFAVILAIVRMSGRDAPEATPVIEGISARIHALLDAHNATQGGDADEGRGDMRLLIDKVLAPYASSENPVEIDGPEMVLTTREATPLGLVLHELATNAVKYGAWAQDGGKIVIKWRYENEGEDRELVLVWRELSANPTVPGEREGFGTMLMRSSARQLDGAIERRFEDRGLVVDIRFPHAA